MTEAILTSYLPKLELELTRTLGLTVDFGAIEPEFALLRPRFLIQDLKVTDPLKEVEVFSAPRAVVEFDLAEMLFTFSPKIRLIEFSGQTKLDLTSQIKPEPKPGADRAVEEKGPDFSSLPLARSFRLTFKVGETPHTVVAPYKGEPLHLTFVGLDARPALTGQGLVGEVAATDLSVTSKDWFKTEARFQAVRGQIKSATELGTQIIIRDGAEVSVTKNGEVLSLELKSVPVSDVDALAIPPFLNPSLRTKVFGILRKGTVRSARMGITGDLVTLDAELSGAEVLPGPGLPLLTDVDGSVSLLDEKLTFGTTHFEVAGGPGGRLSGSLALADGKAGRLVFAFQSDVRPAQLAQLTQVEVLKDGLSPVVEKCFPKKAFQVVADYESAPKRMNLALAGVECELESKTEGDSPKDVLALKSGKLTYADDNWRMNEAEGSFSDVEFKLSAIADAPGLKTELTLSQGATDQLFKRMDLTSLSAKVSSALKFEGVTELAFGKGQTSGTEWKTELKAMAGEIELTAGATRSGAWAFPAPLLIKAKQAASAKSSVIEVETEFAKWNAFGVEAPGLKVKAAIAPEIKVDFTSEPLEGSLTFMRGITGTPATPSKLQANLSRVHRKEVTEQEDSASEVDDPPPATELSLPSLDIAIQDFKDGKRRFGRVILKATRAPDRWTVDESTARGGEVEWELNRLTTVKSETGLKTQVKADLRFRNLVKEFQKSKTLGAVRVDNGIVSLSGDWPGEPQDFSLARLDGEMKGQFAQGKLEQVRSFGQTLINVLSNSRSDARKEQIQFYLASFRFRILDGFILNDYAQALLGSVLVKVTGKSKVKGRTLTMEAAISPGVKDIPVDLEDSESHFGTFRYKVGGTWKEPKLGLKLF